MEWVGAMDRERDFAANTQSFRLRTLFWSRFVPTLGLNHDSDLIFDLRFDFTSDLTSDLDSVFRLRGRRAGSAIAAVGAPLSTCADRGRSLQGA